MVGMASKSIPRIDSSNAASKRKRHPCTWHGCKRMFACPHNVEQHIREKHTLEKPYACAVCAEQGKYRAFSRPYLLYRHQRTIHKMTVHTNRPRKSMVPREHQVEMCANRSEHQPGPLQHVSSTPALTPGTSCAASESELPYHPMQYLDVARASSLLSVQEDLTPAQSELHGNTPASMHSPCMFQEQNQAPTQYVPKNEPATFDHHAYYYGSFMTTSAAGYAIPSENLRLGAEMFAAIPQRKHQSHEAHLLLGDWWTHNAIQPSCFDNFVDDWNIPTILAGWQSQG